MTQYVRYTPRAVQLIRNGATALDLGWSDSMFDSVCATHRIMRTKAAPKPTAPVPSIRECAGISFNEKTSEVIRASIVVALPATQASAFKVLYDRFAADDAAFLSASSICDRGTQISTARNVAFAITRMNEKLAPLRLWVEGKLGKSGGYRLRVEA